jgi:hypothetical protein
VLKSIKLIRSSVLVHSGDLNAGHYYAFLKPTKDGDFLKFDDDRVTKAMKREAMDENFGGEYITPASHDGSRTVLTKAIKRSMNAYMLVYLRKNKIDEILVPVHKEDAPAHLRTLVLSIPDHSELLTLPCSQTFRGRTSGARAEKTRPRRAASLPYGEGYYEETVPSAHGVRFGNL